MKNGVRRTESCALGTTIPPPSKLRLSQFLADAPDHSQHDQKYRMGDVGLSAKPTPTVFGNGVPRDAVLALASSSPLRQHGRPGSGPE